MELTFKNKNFTKRNSEVTNLVYCKSVEAPNANWVPVSEEIPANLDQLFTEWANGGKATYYGYL